MISVHRYMVYCNYGLTYDIVVIILIFISIFNKQFDLLKCFKHDIHFPYIKQTFNFIIAIFLDSWIIDNT